jgi:uncharacterized protein YndB with AHSA1/START domain/DNA-binding transcriptional ArsR family regulator
MEYGSVEREFHIDASPEAVFEVVSSPKHIREWWSDEADFEPAPGATGELVWGDKATARAAVVPITVVDAEPPRLFSFRWVYPNGEVATPRQLPAGDLRARPVGRGHRGSAHRSWVPRDGLGGCCPRGVLQRTLRGLGHPPCPPRRVPRAAGFYPVTVVINDDLWSAIGDPTRRRMLDLLLADGDGTATTLSEQLPVTRQAVAKHLGVLDRVGLVHVTPAGREMRYRVDDAQLARAVAQLSTVGAAWDARLRRIKRIAEAIQRGQEE